MKYEDGCNCMDLVIDEELKALIPPLTEDERRQLGDNLMSHGGARDPLVVWDQEGTRTIIDGHNRFEICTTYRLPFEVKVIKFASKDEAKIWMIDNQKGRRNITDGWKFELAQAKKLILSEKGKQCQGVRTDLLSKVDKKSDRPHNTRDELAKDLGWSAGKVAMADKVWRDAAPDIKDKVKAGDVSINQAYQDIRKEEKKAERASILEIQKKAIESGEVKLPSGVFEVVAMDPPWNYGREYDPDSSRVANPYPEMTQQQLLKLNPPFAKDCVFLLWTTHAFIFDARELLDNWGFEYKATLVWDKEKMGMGAWLRMQCEFCLLGIKGKPIWNNTKWRDILREPRREHSRKPDAFYAMVEEITLGRRLEYFSREQRKGWETYGNDTQKF